MHAYLLFAFLALIYSVCADRNRANLQELKEKCSSISGADIESTTELRPVDSKMMCYRACFVMTKRGHLNDDGSLNGEKMIDRVQIDHPNREAVITAIRECSDKTSEEVCQTIREYVKCRHEKAPGRRSGRPNKQSPPEDEEN